MDPAWLQDMLAKNRGEADGSIIERWTPFTNLKSLFQEIFQKEIGVMHLKKWIVYQSQYARWIQLNNVRDRLLDHTLEIIKGI